MRIESLQAMEILDSRGRPTLAVTCRLAGGAEGAVSIPSGASTGAAEAIELRDGDPGRYRGLGCRRAAANVEGEILDHVRGKNLDQRELDLALRELDGTPQLARLGANAVLGVSLAFARAGASELRVPLYRNLAHLSGQDATQLPRLTINLFSGGRHAGGQVAIQDVLIVPRSARTMDESLSMAWAVYQSAAELALRKYGARPLKADEGGLAPPFPNAETMLNDAVESIRLAGFEPAADVALAVDVAASHFFREGRYHLDGESLDSPAMIGRLVDWASRYPLISIEDGLGEEDWLHWAAMRPALQGRVLVMGDDLLCTSPSRIERAISSRAADALLLKVNQVGTLSDAAAALRLARAAAWSVTVSARSGETEDNWLADLAVGWGADFIKIGSIAQSERLCKYNRLLEIEARDGLPLRPWSGFGLGRGD